MRHIIRQTLIAMSYGIIILMLAIGVMLYIFEIDWKTLFTQNINNIPLVGILLMIPILIGVIIGIVTGSYWSQHIQRITRQLEQLVNGQPLSQEINPEQELQEIQQQMEKIQEKIKQQTELNQKMATERAVEREQSLQEIVLQERSKLARELHDSVSQELFAVSMMMSAMNETKLPMDEGIQQQLQTVEKMINQAQLEMRALLLHLRPVALKGKTMQEGIQDLLNELLQKVPLAIEWKIEAFSVDKGVEDQLFRILQESVSNTLRHAKANTLRVMLIKRDGYIILRVADDGVGFDMKLEKTGSYGLETMRERAYEIGGSFKLISLPNQGTNLEVKVPILGNEGDVND
ncbi:sensor histidine kinase [Lentibacillus sp. N15]|uniref:sensor histidine kinase n=1 Tax=Lentibacillus songyuanensis TaxID=3136161 RepID=UPI0031BA1E85